MMQSEESEDTDQSRIVSSATEMTYTIDKSNSGIKNAALEADNIKSSQLDIELSSIDFSKLLPPPQSTSSSSASSEVTEDCPEVDVKPELSITLADGERADPIQLKNIQEHNPNESIRNWLLRISKMQTEIQKQIHTENNESQSSLSGVSGTKAVNQQFNEFTTKKCAPANSGRVVKYQDLPYMGEMTLDNSKPRRGRKPKKADICHLIYKNYGTIFPGTPNSKVLQEFVAKREPELLQNSAGEVFNRSDVQNRIISSLLEKRLTQESKRQKETLLSRRNAQEEPLNLCIRDLDQLKIRLLRKNDVFVSQSVVNIKTEPHSDDEVEFVHETPSLQVKDPALTPEAPALAEGLPPIATPDNNYVYWSNSGVFIHPLALQQQLLYYQKMANNNKYNLPPPGGQPVPTIVPFPTPLMPPEVPPSPENTSSSNSSELRKLVPKVRTIKIKDSSSTDKPSPKRNSIRNCDKQQSPTKRKRSAIFIPPIPAENQTNPATEVSICKFKFTGGAKPTLQEKKMLSVDAAGNFRYYSGTGDKSMRGYEFFPREALQQQVGNAHGSSTGAFLQASGEKIYPVSGSPDNMTDIAGKAVLNEFMLTPELPSSSVILPTFAPMGPNNTISPTNQFKHHSTSSNSSSANNKRKTRKSLQREKLEQTFKEKGFLIQTQQLESAEGATYCKFRQLRKFTRYLFRSWKDYLPNGGVAEGIPGGSGVQLERPDMLEDGSMLSEVDMESLSKMSRSSTASSNDVLSPTPSQT